MSKSSSSSSSSSSFSSSEAEDRQDTEPAEDHVVSRQSQEEAGLDFCLALDLSLRLDVKSDFNLSVLFCCFPLQTSRESVEYYTLEHRSQISTCRSNKVKS